MKALDTTKSDVDLLWSRLRNLAGTRPWRSPSWKRHITSMRCVFCRQPADDPHHLFGSYGSLKTSDVFTVPVCRVCHNNRAEDPRERALLLEKWIELAMLTIEQDRTLDP